ncbi:MAG: hypothetical protein Aurels2KO_01610 [Aureliella sp.]
MKTGRSVADRFGNGFSGKVFDFFPPKPVLDARIGQSDAATLADTTATVSLDGLIKHY